MSRHALALCAVLAVSACASQEGVLSGAHVARDGMNAAALTVVHDPATRPALLRLAEADYAIDGKPILALRAPARAGDVPDKAEWRGALRPGNHVIEARLRYPVRDAGLDGVEFTVIESWRFKADGAGPVRIRVEEACDSARVSASMDKRLRVRFSTF